MLLSCCLERKTVSDGNCSVCKKPLSGQTVEACNTVFHVACFKCAGCARPFAKTCLNIDGKPYCGMYP
jgi:hypothetical protein